MKGAGVLGWFQVDDGHPQDIDQERIIGVFSRSNVSTDKMNDDQIRHFYEYQHKTAVKPLKKALAEVRQFTMDYVSTKSDAPIFKSDMYERLLEVYVWFIKARWSLFLARNSGFRGSAHNTFFLFRRYFFEHPDRLAHATTWVLLGFFALVDWRNPELDWAKVALWFLYNVFTGTPQKFVPDGSLVEVFRGCYNQQCRHKFVVILELFGGRSRELGVMVQALVLHTATTGTLAELEAALLNIDGIGAFNTKELASG